MTPKLEYDPSSEAILESEEVSDGIPVIETGETTRKKISGSVPEK